MNYLLTVELGGVNYHHGIYGIVYSLDSEGGAVRTKFNNEPIAVLGN
jgi:hypothetical protein